MEDNDTNFQQKLEKHINKINLAEKHYDSPKAESLHFRGTIENIDLIN